MSTRGGSSDRVFISGLGFQKCGTSWIYDYLKQSRYFDGGFDKEYHIWDAIDVPLLKYNLVDKPSFLGRALENKRMKRYNMQSNENAYFEYFNSLYRGDVSITGDITPSYSALSKTRMASIIDNFQDKGVSCKALLLIRDPIDRIKSAVRYNLDRRYFKEGINVGETNFRRALEGYYTTDHCKIRTRYDHTLNNVYATFDPNDVYVGVYENMFEKDQVTKMSEFFGIDENFEFTKVRVNKTKSKVENMPKLERAIKEYYLEVYEYCNDLFPVTRELWK
ncbi:MAG: sulfotransferase domain-containing protein [Candidatus Thermoplasmatota archaeon]|nr:sulfotransferase domain-containing protein [Candidatus Thermoplasmatota archaeon]